MPLFSQIWLRPNDRRTRVHYRPICAFHDSVDRRRLKVLGRLGGGRLRLCSRRAGMAGLGLDWALQLKRDFGNEGGKIGRISGMGGGCVYQ